MNHLVTSAVGLILIVNIGTSLAVSRCYSCQSYECNDPFNPSVATVMNCSDINSYRSLKLDNNIESNLQNQNTNEVLFSTFNTPYQETVCVKYFVTSTISSLSNFTVRRCMPKSYNNMGACEFARQATDSSRLGQVQSCSACESDLCNSSNQMSGVALLAVVFFASVGFLL